MCTVCAISNATVTPLRGIPRTPPHVVAHEADLAFVQVSCTNVN